MAANTRQEERQQPEEEDEDGEGKEDDDGEGNENGNGEGKPGRKRDSRHLAVGVEVGIEADGAASGGEQLHLPAAPPQSRPATRSANAGGVLHASIVLGGWRGAEDDVLGLPGSVSLGGKGAGRGPSGGCWGSRRGGAHRTRRACKPQKKVIQPRTVQNITEHRDLKDEAPSCNTGQCAELHSTSGSKSRKGEAAPPRQHRTVHWGRTGGGRGVLYP